MPSVQLDHAARPHLGPVPRSLAATLTGLLLLLLPALLTPGCDQSPQAQVMRTYDAGELAIKNFNTDNLRAMMSQTEHDAMVSTLGWAKRGRRPDLERLPLPTLATVLALRNRLSTPQHIDLQPDDMLVWLIQAKILVVDAEYGFKPISVSVTGDSADMQMGMYVEGTRKIRRRRLGSVRVPTMVLVPVPGLLYHYTKVGGVWTWDFDRNLWSYLQWLTTMAQDEGLSPVEFLLAQEEAEHGSIKPDVWRPVE
jgi:hypothetical protein